MHRRTTTWPVGREAPMGREAPTGQVANESPARNASNTKKWNQKGKNEDESWTRLLSCTRTEAPSRPNVARRAAEVGRPVPSSIEAE